LFTITDPIFFAVVHFVQREAVIRLIFCRKDGWLSHIQVACRSSYTRSYVSALCQGRTSSALAVHVYVHVGYISTSNGL